MRTTVLATWDPPVFTLRLRGEFDLATQRLLRWRFVDARKLGCSSIRVDASEVTYIDCGSLQLLCDAGEQAAAEGGQLVVTQASPLFGLVAEAGGFHALRPTKETRPCPDQRLVRVVPAPGQDGTPAVRR